MLPIDAIRVIPCSNLRAGDLVFLLDGFGESLIAGANQYGIVATVPLAGESKDIVPLNDLPGRAMVIRDWGIEVDHTSASKTDPRAPRTLSMSGRGIMIDGSYASEIHRMSIQDSGEAPDGGGPVFFNRWNIVYRNGIEKVTLCTIG
ncbi:MAG: hypothetical protein ACJLS3_07765 [Erythrobacter sp.]